MDLHQQEVEMWERESSGREEKCSTLGKLQPLDYMEFEVVEMVKASESSRIFKFRLGSSQVLGHKSGQHLVVRGQWDGQPVTRQYSILSRAATIGSFSLLIKVYPLGIMSGVVQDWTLGSRISARGPFGEPPALLEKETKVVMFCQGTGLVPLLPMLQDLLEEETETIVNLLYSSSSAGELLLLQNLNELCGFWNFRLRIFLSSGETLMGRVPQREVVGRRLEKKDVAEEAEKGSRFLVCGSKQYTKQLCGWISEEGVPDHAIHKF